MSLDHVAAFVRHALGGATPEPHHAGRAFDNYASEIGQAVPPDLAAVRSAAATVDYQIVVRGSWLSAVLDIVPTADATLAVTGEIIECDDVCSVQLLLDGDDVATTVTDDFGAFAFEGLVPGVYEIVFAGPSSEVVTEVRLEL